MEDSPTQIGSRIEWCRRMRGKTTTRDEEADWRAEEAGLLDAFLGIDRTEIARYCHPSRLTRYQLGFVDGQTLMRLCDGADGQHRATAASAWSRQSGRGSSWRSSLIFVSEATRRFESEDGNTPCG